MNQFGSHQLSKSTCANNDVPDSESNLIFVHPVPCTRRTGSNALVPIVSLHGDQDRMDVCKAKKDILGKSLLSHVLIYFVANHKSSSTSDAFAAGVLNRVRS